MKIFARTAIFAFVLASFLPGVSRAAVPGQLIKLSCVGNAGVNDPCKAVYHYGKDGRRHAFPNEKVYFSWNTDFAGVQTVTSAAMAAIPLGSNVTYRPAVKMVKFVTDLKTYAVGLGGELRWVKTEDAARSLYGLDWNKKVDDISDAFFTDYRIGADIAVITDFNREAELAAAPTIDDDLETTYERKTIVLSSGSFTIDLVKIQRARYSMVTDTGDTDDCSKDCNARELKTYVEMNRGTVGIHGSYFCPPDYADCASKINTFLGPVYNAPASTMINAKDVQVHQGPMLAQLEDGQTFYFHRTQEFGGSVSGFEALHGSKLTGAISNYPSMVENGAVIVENESRLEDAQRTVKATRGAIGYDDRFFYLAIIRSATVVDAAYVMASLGAENAMNLDGGGSVAMYYDGAYKAGPGRLLPNAIVFRKN